MDSKFRLHTVLDPLLDYHLSYITNRLATSKASVGLKELYPVEWLKSSATVRVNIGRQTGKSMYVARNAEDNDIIICHDPLHLETMKQRRSIYRSQGCDLRVFSVEEALSFTGTIQDVWITDGSSLSEDYENRLYEGLGGKCRRFIIIG